MRKHEEVIKAWLDGKDIQYKYKNGTKWLDTSKDVSANPMTYNELMWRVKPVLVQVDYDALVDSNLIVDLYDSTDMLHGKMTTLEGYYSYQIKPFIAHDEEQHSKLAFFENILQVVSEKDLRILNHGGFETELVSSYYNDRGQPYCVIRLVGIQEGYTL
jgi:hypothetical protein